ncbi:MAG: HYR domain-containing protein, partial [Bacteroidota bacterium]
LSGHTGNVLRWESSIDNFATIVTIANTTTTQPYLNITQTTKYRAVIQNGVCFAANSTPATITINDVQPPTISCPANITVSCASAVPAVNIASVIATDNCSAVVITHVGDVITAQTCTNKYTLTRTYRAADATGNSTTCSQIITVNDIIPPTLTCPAAVTVNCTGAVPVVNIASVTAADNCSGVVVTHVGDVISAQTCANRYTITRTYRATDVCGNFTQCTQLIIVNDMIAPVISCPANITTATTTGSCTALVTFSPTATDNCGGTVTITSVPASGTLFPIGTTAVTVTATDACGNSSACTFNVTITDGQLPVISTAPANKTVCATATAVFSVTASNAVSYQWQQFIGGVWTNMAGQTGSSLTIPAVTQNMNTNTFRVNITGSCTTITSGLASLYVNPLPTISIAASTSPELLPTQTTNIIASVDPAGGIFAWFKNGTARVPTVTTGTLSGLTVDDAGVYKVIYTDLNGCVNTSGEVVISAAATERFYVAPNPNYGQFWVRYYNQVNEQLTLRVYDARGRVVHQQTASSNLPYTRINVDLRRSTPAGIYLVELRGAGGRRLGVKRIVVYDR